MFSGARAILTSAGTVLILWGVFRWATAPVTPLTLGFLEWMWMFVGLSASVLAWRYGVHRRDTPHWLVLCSGYLVAMRLCHAWGERAQDFIAPVGVLWTGLGILALTTAAVCDLLTRDLRHRAASEKDSSSGETEPAPDNGPARLSSPHLWLGAVAPLLALTVVAGSLLSLGNQGISTAAPGPQPYPDLPPRVSGEVAWSTTLEGDSYAGAAGIRGPLIAVEDGVIALDAADGRILWQHRRQSSEVLRTDAVSRREVAADRIYLMTSPDHAYVAVAFKHSRHDLTFTGVVEVLETATGRTVAQRPITEENIAPPVQLTNQMAWIGAEGVRLSDGVTIWKKPHPRIPGGVMGLDSQFISQTDCADASPCSVTLFPDSNPDSHQRVDNILTDPTSQLSTAHGWVAQLAPGAAPVDEDEDEEQTTMQAHSLDTGETVPLGDFNRVLNSSEPRLVLMRSNLSQAVFDPVTKALTNDIPATGDEPPAYDSNFWPTNEPWQADWEKSPFPDSSRAMLVSWGGETLRIPFGLAAGTKGFGNGGDERVTVWATPGCVMVQGRSFGAETAGRDNQSHTHLACVR